MSTINASVYRHTRFELRSLTQGPNSFMVVASPRDVPPDVVIEDGREVIRALRTPELEIPEEDFSDQEMALVHAVLEMLEHKFAAVFDRWANAPGRIVEVVNATIAAEQRLAELKAEAEKLEAENAARRAAK